MCQRTPPSHRVGFLSSPFREGRGDGRIGWRGAWRGNDIGGTSGESPRSTDRQGDPRPHQPRLLLGRTTRNGFKATPRVSTVDGLGTMARPSTPA